MNEKKEEDWVLTVTLVGIWMFWVGVILFRCLVTYCDGGRKIVAYDMLQLILWGFVAVQSGGVELTRMT